MTYQFGNEEVQAEYVKLSNTTQARMLLRLREGFALQVNGCSFGCERCDRRIRNVAEYLSEASWNNEKLREFLEFDGRNWWLVFFPEGEGILAPYLEKFGFGDLIPWD